MGTLLHSRSPARPAGNGCSKPYRKKNPMKTDVISLDAVRSADELVCPEPLLTRLGWCRAKRAYADGRIDAGDLIGVDIHDETKPVIGRLYMMRDATGVFVGDYSGGSEQVLGRVVWIGRGTLT